MEAFSLHVHTRKGAEMGRKRNLLTDTLTNLMTPIPAYEVPKDPQGKSRYDPGWVQEPSGKLWVMGSAVDPSPHRGLDLEWLEELFRETMDWHGSLMSFEPECEMAALMVGISGPLLSDPGLRAHMKPVLSRKDGTVQELIVNVKLGGQQVELHFMHETPLANGQGYCFRIKNHPGYVKHVEYDDVWCTHPER
jgi:hypothetical protein